MRGGQLPYCCAIFHRESWTGCHIPGVKIPPDTGDFLNGFRNPQNGRTHIQILHDTLVRFIKDQYIFCHDAVLEHLLCGDTSVPAPTLQVYIKELSTVDQETQINGYEKEMKVLTSIHIQ